MKIFVVGAGPVGLFTAALLAQKGHQVEVFERKAGLQSQSNAIGITPPSLELLRKLGLDQRLADQGTRIQKVTVHSHKRVLGRVSFAELPGDYPFILTVPQSVTEALLWEFLQGQKAVQVHFSREMVGLRPDALSVTADFQGPHGAESRTADLLIGCDGGKSFTRKFLGSRDFFKAYKPTFLMGDFRDAGTWGSEAHLFFTPWGAVESFPLGPGRRRWILQTPTFLDQAGDYIVQQVARRTGIILNPADQLWESPFGMQRMHSSLQGRGRIFLAGDALHLMSPIGGQGMNTGFADAAALVEFLSQDPFSAKNLEILRRDRLKAARSAARRSAASLWIGTQKSWASVLRNLFLWILLRGPWKVLIPPHYAMQTIPRGLFSRRIFQ